MNAILDGREQRAKFVQSLAEKSPVVTIKANTPGPDKNLAESWLLVRYFANNLPFSAEFVGIYGGADGPFAAFNVGDAQIAKDRAVSLEESHEIGRFADIDVYDFGGKPLSRGKLRKCYVCDQPAAVCMRSGKHSQTQIRAAFTEKIDGYFRKRITQAVFSSALAELNLTDKFGLVSPVSCGSHPDMSYETMYSALCAITPHLAEMFFIGAKSSGNLRAILTAEGKAAERAMYEATGGANAYKGLIFIMGLLLGAYGRAAVSEGKDAFAIIKENCKDVFAEFDNCDTFGARAYKSFGIAGARGEAKNGLPAVQAVAKLLEEQGGQNLLQALTYAVAATEDTVLLKRCGSIEKYESYKRKISSADVTDKLALKTLNDECIADNVSIGGSADVLATAALCGQLASLLRL